MGSTGGSIEECTLDKKRFSVAADAEAERDLGGFTNEIESNGDGTVRLVKIRKPWRIGGLVLDIDDNRGQHETLQGIADRKELVPVTVTLASGKTYQGRGQIEEEIKWNSKNSTAEISLAGEQKLTPQ